MQVIPDASCEGDVVATVGKAGKVRISIEDGHTKTSPSSSFEEWLCVEMVARGHKTLTRDGLRDTFGWVRNRAKDLFGPDVVNKSASRAASDAFKWAQTNDFDPFSEENLTKTDRGNWAGKAPCLPPKGRGVSSSVPAKFRRGSEDRTSFVPSAEAEGPEPFIEEELDLELGLGDVIEKASTKLAAEIVTSKEIVAQPWPERPSGWLMTFVGQDLDFERFENCKILDCSYLALKPKLRAGKGTMTDAMSVCPTCTISDMKKCPQDQPMSVGEKEIYDSIVASTPEPAAKRAIFKIRHLARKKALEKSGG